MKHFWVGGATVIFSALWGATSFAGVKLIHGTPVTDGEFPEIVNLQTAGAPCTATIIGPRVIVTSAHCAPENSIARFALGATTYEARITRSPLFSSQTHDIAVGITSRNLRGVEPAYIGGAVSQGDEVQLFGYGCTQPGGGGGTTGALLQGKSTVIAISGLEFITRRADGAAICFGDSGGPSYALGRDKHTVVGINYKGNVLDTNYTIRMDTPATQDFFKKITSTNNVDICGVSPSCGNNPPPPPPTPAPTCTLAVTPSSAHVGDSVTLTLLTQGQVTAASIDSESVAFPNGQKVVVTTAAGTFSAKGAVSGPGGSGACQVDYSVTPPIQPNTAPTCTLTATPDTIDLGDSITLQLTAQGSATSGSIDETSVTLPVGKKLMTPPAKGTFTSVGKVVGAGGSNICSVQYTVQGGTPPPDPSTPNLAVVPTYCGENTLIQTKVRKVCLGILKKDNTLAALRVNDVLLITYRDGTQEVMPFLNRRTVSKQTSIQSQELITLYANAAIPANKFLVLDTRTATLTVANQRAGVTPTAIQGSTMTGQTFVVDKLSAYGISD
jgi:V8-like Glu-specific endopeptidase